MEPNTAVADQNTERLIQAAYPPAPVPPAFAAELEAKLTAAVKTLAQPVPAPSKRWRRYALIVGGMAACILVVFAYIAFQRSASPIEDKPPQVKVTPPVPADEPQPTKPPIRMAKWTDDARDGMMPRKRPDAPALDSLKDGKKLATKAGQRRLVQLGDGTRLYVNEKTEVESTGSRQLTLQKGQIYLEVAPLDKAPHFIVKAANREITATGTHFAVQADAGVTVTQGKVAVKGIATEVAAGQQLAPAASAVTSAPRASHTLAWTRELMAAAETPMMPATAHAGGAHAGGALLALDPQGQEIKLALRKYHIDVHIEDGFARTTIDQTYFNTTWERLEGTFYFPLPADASLSRLAMYVVDGNQCKLMEGGMAERKHAADVYETIRYQRRDPALLEWLDGTTFKMRVFPLEAKQEKRIILSYTQKLVSLYGTARYRFAGGLNMPIVREWSFNARVKSGAGMYIWSPSHADMIAIPQGGDTLLRHIANNVKPADDVVLELQDRNAHLDKDEPRFTSFLHDNHMYLMLRYRPTLPSMPDRQRRDWIVLFEASASRDPLVAGTQVDIVRQILKNAEYDDTFTLVTANSKVQTWGDKPQPARPKNVDDAIKFLQTTHLVGALDLQQGLQAALKLAKDAKNPHLLHIGAGIPAMGERDAGKLAKLLPERVRYVGVGVGKRWNRAFMKAAAERTGGLFTQINPDEVIAWRSFELLATLNTPRLLDVQVVDANGKAPFLMETSMIAQGEELCAITRVDTSKTALPGKVLVKGTLDGKPMVKEFPVMNVLSGAGYLPRTWAKQEIDRLLTANAAKHKDEIIALSKAMYVMSPYTSLLVLETDADYEKYKVDRGRKDHWAMYQCPPKIPQVYEPDGKPPVKPERKKDAKPTCEEVMGTITPVPFVVDGGISRDFEVIRLRNTVAVDVAQVLDEAFNGPKTPTRVENIRVVADARTNTLLVQAKPIDLLTIRRLVAKQLDVPPGAASPMTFGPWAPGGGLMGGGAGASNGEGVIETARSDRDSWIDRAGWSQRMVKKGFLPAVDVEEGRSGMKDEEPPIHFPPLASWKALSKVRKDKYVVDDDVKAPRLPVQIEPIPSLGIFVIRDDAKKDDGTLRVQSIKDIDPAILQQAVDAISGKTRREPGGFAPGGSAPGAFGTPGRGFGGGGFGGGGTVNSFVNFYGDPFSMGLASKYTNSPESPGVKFGRGTYKTTTTPTSEASFQYERPPFEYNPTLFTDLVQYAPGLHNTHADILATLEAEADVETPKLGGIDADARRLIERARSAAWVALTIPAEGPLASYPIHYNGIGQFAYTRILVSGLREHVVCDGKTLWHLYPDIGLAAKRPFSRYHQSLAASFNPAFLPAAEELARGYHLKAIDGSTVALVPVREGEAPAEPKRRASTGSTARQEPRPPELHLVFAKDGRLSERRIVEMPGAKIVLRQIFQADGVIEWKGADDKLLAKQTRSIAPAQAPNLEPSVRDLVVMAMPIRTREHEMAKARKLGADVDSNPEAVASLFISECVTGNPYHDKGINLHKLFRQQKDRRLGFFTLLNAASANLNLAQGPDGKAVQVDIEKDHPNSALATLLVQGQREINAKDQSLIANIPGPKDGFIQRMTRFRNLWLIWQNQRNGVSMPVELAKVIEFLEDTPSPSFAYAVLDTMQRRGQKPPTDHMLDIAVKRFGPISDPVGLGYVFRYEHARSLSQAGRAVESAKAFKALHADTLKFGVLPPIDSAFRDALQMPIGDGPKFIGFTRKTLDDLLAKKRYRNAFQLAQQVDQLGDEAMCDEIMTTILAKASAEERNGLTLACVQFQAGRKNFAQADRLLAKVLEDKKLSQYAELWRWRAELTKSYGQTAASIACLEKALDLEYAELPELVNLESIRTDYRTLLGHYQKIAEANASLETPAPKTFLAKVIRTADRWRLIDSDGAEPSQLAGKIMHTLGERELAWDYWTTPIDLHPAESKPWLDLAETMKAEGDLERADRAFGLAFDAEATNPEILWKRAQNLVRMSQPDRARQLYRQIAEGAWQERFAATVEQARGLAAGR